MGCVGNTHTNPGTKVLKVLLTWVECDVGESCRGSNTPVLSNKTVFHGRIKVDCGLHAGRSSVTIVSLPARVWRRQRQPFERQIHVLASQNQCEVVKFVRAIVKFTRAMLKFTVDAVKFIVQFSNLIFDEIRDEACGKKWPAMVLTFFR